MDGHGYIYFCLLVIFFAMLIIGITGTLGAGKGSIVRYLVERYGFVHFSSRKLLVEKMEQKGMEINRDMMKVMADSLREKYGPGYILEELYGQAKEGGKDAILESVRAVGEVESLRAKGDFYLFAIDADPSIRYERIRLRNNETDHVSYPVFISNEEREMHSDDPNKQNLRACITLADRVFMNNGTLEDLHKQIDEVMNRIVE